MTDPAPPERPEGPEPQESIIDSEVALTLLREGELSVEGRLVDASNATLFCAVELDGLAAACVYKPVKGERPLWDFPDGTLAGREVAAYAVSEATGWNVVPPTVMRDGPFGRGMVQLWMDGDESVDLRRLIRRDTAALRRMAVFDAVVNNADRKGGHLIPVPGGHVYGVDHGVCFAVEPKLRTVLWGWAGEPLTEETVDVLSELCGLLHGDLRTELTRLLTRREVGATLRRVEELLSTGRHPMPSDEWPAIPWPPF